MFVVICSGRIDPSFLLAVTTACLDEDAELGCDNCIDADDDLQCDGDGIATTDEDTATNSSATSPLIIHSINDNTTAGIIQKNAI